MSQTYHRVMIDIDSRLAPPLCRHVSSFTAAHKIANRWLRTAEKNGITAEVVIHRVTLPGTRVRDWLSALDGKASLVQTVWTGRYPQQAEAKPPYTTNKGW